MKIYGKNALREALRNNHPIEEIYFCDNIKDYELQEVALKQNIKVKTLNKNIFVKQFGEKTGGVVAIAKDYQYTSLDQVLQNCAKKSEALILILDGIEDPHNLGAILRSAEATKTDAVIIPKNRSVGINETVVKVSTGAIEHINVVMVTNLNQTIETLKENNFWVIGLELTGTMDYKEADYRGKIAIVVGSEGRGISQLVQKNCDYLVKIPMYGKVNSLNASVSAGLILYEAIRHRGTNE